MIETPIGNLIILVNNYKIEYEYSELENKTKSYYVDKRFEINTKLNAYGNNVIILECYFDSDKKYNSYIESGEKLLCNSFYMNSIKLCLSTEDEILGIEYEYTKKGFLLSIDRDLNKEIDKIRIGLAWLNMQEESIEELYPWLGADLT